MYPLLLDRLVERSAHDTGDVINDVIGGMRLSPAELLDLARRQAGVLVDLGITPGSTVATMISTSVEGVVAWLSCAIAGAIEVPLSTEIRRDLMAAQLTASGASVLIADDGPLADVAALPRASHPVRHMLRTSQSPRPPQVIATRLSVADAATERRGRVPLDVALPSATDVACGVLTSGTTGSPKCVLVPWGQLRQMFTRAMTPSRETDEVSLAFTPLNHLIARGMVYRGLLHTCGRVALRPRFSLSHWWEDVRTQRATEAILPASAASWIMRLPESGIDGDNPLRRVIITPLTPGADLFARRFRTQVSIAYGATEIGMPIAQTGLPADLRSCGRVVPGSDVRIQSPIDGSLVPVGQIGELAVRAVEGSVSTNYLGTPDTIANDGWITTGDLFRADAAGDYYFVERLHDLIRRRGENIAPSQIEHVALRHQDVAVAAAVATVADDGEDEVVLYVQPHEGSGSSLLDELRALLVRELPRFMIPSRITLLDEIPMTPTGKVQRRALRDWDTQ